MRKYATLTLAKDTAVVGSGMQQRVARLSDFPSFNPQPGFLYVTARAISNRVNANFDGWPADELRKAYGSFIGRPVFVDHTNWDLKRARGVIVDAKLHEGKLASGHEDVWVELLIEVDANAFPRLARAILSGDVDAVSMGADVTHTRCSVCDHIARDVSEYCEHIPSKKGHKFVVGGIEKLCFEHCYGVNFFEISFVFDPADESALITDKLLYQAATASVRTTSRIRRPRETVEAYGERVGFAKAAKVSDRALMTIPDSVDTTQSGDVYCPRCGAEIGASETVCPSCGMEIPPPGLGDPDPEAPQWPVQQEAPEAPADQEAPDQQEEEQEDKKVSKFQEVAESMQRRATPTGQPLGVHDVGTQYDQTTLPESTSVTPYGQGGEQQAVTPEAPVATTSQEATPDAREDVQNLDASAIQAGPGNSNVNVGQPDGVQQADVQALDAPPPVNLSPDATINVQAPTEQGNQLERADTTDTIDANAEGTGLGFPIDRPEYTQGPNQFTDVGPYQRGANAPTEEQPHKQARIFRILSFVEARVELGLTPRESKIADVGRFERMPDAELQGWINATEEFKSTKARVASRRLQVTAGAGRAPAMGAEPRLASAQEDSAAMEDGDIYAALL